MAVPPFLSLFFPPRVQRVLPLFIPFFIGTYVVPIHGPNYFFFFPALTRPILISPPPPVASISFSLVMRNGGRPCRHGFDESSPPQYSSVLTTRRPSRWLSVLHARPMTRTHEKRSPYFLRQLSPAKVGDVHTPPFL